VSCGMELTADAVDKKAHHEIDALEALMLGSMPPLHQPLRHTFAPGLYVRAIFNPAGSLITTKVHKTTHPFFVLQGRVSVYVPGGEVEHITAPHMGVTLAGTRRVIFVHEDTVWVTVHPNPDDGTDLAAIEERLIERRELPDSGGRTAFECYSELLEKLTGRPLDVVALLVPLPVQSTEVPT
jgi:hypothetical protein